LSPGVLSIDSRTKQKKEINISKRKSNELSQKINIHAVLISLGECSSFVKKRDLSANLQKFSNFYVSFTESVRMGVF